MDSIDSDFVVGLPPPVQMLDANIAPELNLKAKNASGECKVIIGQIDTGLQLSKAFDSFLLPTISIGGNSQAAGSQPSRSLSHGSAMAETILRSIQNTTKGSTSAKILPVDVYGNNPTTTTFDVAQGVYQAVNGGANIINLSLGGTGDSTVLHNLIKSASQQGVVFFAAAGNEPVTTPTFPAAYPEVIAVTAGDRNGQLANYANRGTFVDIMTPGISIVPYDGQSYIVTGTSPATAFASGIAAGLADSSQICPSQVIPTIRSKLGVNLTPSR
jgi:thermitase